MPWAEVKGLSCVSSLSGDKEDSINDRTVDSKPQGNIGALQQVRGVGFAHQCKRESTESERSGLNIMRVCTG